MVERDIHSRYPKINPRALNTQSSKLNSNFAIMGPGISVPNMIKGRNIRAQNDGVRLSVRLFTYLGLMKS